MWWWETLNYLSQRDKNSLLIEFRILWSLTSPESTIFIIFLSPNIFRTTLNNTDCVTSTNQKFIYRHIFFFSTQEREKKGYLWGPDFLKYRWEVKWQRREILPFCNISGKKKGHGVWRTGEVGSTQVNLVRHFYPQKRVEWPEGNELD